MTILWYINNVERHASCILVGKPIDSTVYVRVSGPKVRFHGLLGCWALQLLTGIFLMG